MASTSNYQSLPFLAPFPTDANPRSSLSIPKRTKRSTACAACKARKSRCRGSQPCDKCLELGTECVFATTLDRRRKIAQRRAEQELKNDLARLGELLSNMKEQRAQGESQQRSVLSVEESSVENVDVEAELKHAIASINSIPGSSRSKFRKNSSSSDASPDSVGSLNEVDTLTEDPNRCIESRAAGYIGKESEIAWMQKLETEADKLDGAIRPESPTEESITAMSYHIDDIQIVEPYYPGDPRLLPPRSWAARLVSMFFESISPAFPLLYQPLFTSQFHQAYSGSAEAPSTWLAVLNLVLATSAKLFQLTDPVAGRDVDDRIFLSRAIALTTTRNLGVEHADLHQVQYNLLLTLYYLVLGQVNRAWQVNGRAVRSAVSLGLNLRALSDQIDPVSKEIRTRIWWSIFSLEHLLSSMTGRAPCADYRSMSLRPPVPYDEGSFHSPELQELLANTQEQEERLQWTIHADDSRLEERARWFQSFPASQSLYFFHSVDLFLITHVAVLAVYSLTAMKETGQSGIPHHQKNLDRWLSNLQAPFAFTNKEGELNLDRNSKVQVSLALEFYSSQIILARPCLTRSDMKAGTNIRFPRSRFGNDTAKICVHSAMALMDVLPDMPDTNWILKKTPWWCILHFIMQALTVLLIQLSIGPATNKLDGVIVQHRDQTPERQRKSRSQGPSKEPPPEHGLDAILTSSKKALRWLHRMAEDDPSSHRAFEISYSFARRIAKAKGLDMSNVLFPEPDEPETSGFSSRTSSAARSRWRSDESAGSSRRQAYVKLQHEGVNWGPDCTVSESDWEQQQVQSPFVLDPALFSADM
ncbi:Zn(II)2Cys6 transcription factor [Aspergillus undulatus]|uniref:Zn(II)2Cys6 transcription factor n=1 Tax=Aspergillus undulatus TaxID=1810928 RepID=UPI003CCE3826